MGRGPESLPRSRVPKSQGGRLRARFTAPLALSPRTGMGAGIDLEQAELHKGWQPTRGRDVRCFAGCSWRYFQVHPGALVESRKHGVA